MAVEKRKYASVADVQNHLVEVDVWPDTHVALLEKMVVRASRLLDRKTGRHPGAYLVDEDETRYFTGSGTTQLWIGELAQAPTQVSVAEGGDISNYTVWDSDEYICWPYNSPLEGEPFLRLDISPMRTTKGVWYAVTRGVRIEGRFGFSLFPPEDLIEATVIQAVKWFKLAQQAYSDVGAIPDLAQLKYTRKLDPDIEEIVSWLSRKVPT